MDNTRKFCPTAVLTPISPDQVLRGGVNSLPLPLPFKESGYKENFSLCNNIPTVQSGIPPIPSLYRLNDSFLISTYLHRNDGSGNLGQVTDLFWEMLHWALLTLIVLIYYWDSQYYQCIESSQVLITDWGPNVESYKIFTADFSYLRVLPIIQTILAKTFSRGKDRLVIRKWYLRFSVSERGEREKWILRHLYYEWPHHTRWEKHSHFLNLGPIMWVTSLCQFGCIKCKVEVGNEAQFCAQGPGSGMTELPCSSEWGCGFKWRKYYQKSINVPLKFRRSI